MSDSPLFVYMNPEEHKKEREKAFWQDALAAIGGGLGGVALGTLLINPAKYMQLRKAEQETAQMRDNFARNKEILQNLVQLHRKKMSLDDFTDEARPGIEAAYEEYQPLLNDPHQLAVEMNRKPPADVVRLPGAPAFRVSQLLPSQDMVRNPLETISHPLPSILGLIGGSAAGYAMNEHHKNQMYDKLRQYQEENHGVPFVQEPIIQS